MTPIHAQAAPFISLFNDIGTRLDERQNGGAS
jgi:hypothetical protein